MNRALEAKRADKSIGSSLSAEVDLYCAPELVESLARLESELRFVLSVSRATVKPLTGAPAGATDTELSGLKLEIIASAHEKCERCWHFTSDIGVSENHPTLCQRCVDNIDGTGETRHFA